MLCTLRENAEREEKLNRKVKGVSDELYIPYTVMSDSIGIAY
jgi:hypothetical protein